MTPLDLIWRDHLRLCRLVPDHAFAGSTPPTQDEYTWRGLLDYDTLVYRNWIMHMTNEEKLGLPPAFPQALSKKLTSNFGFYCKYDGRFIFQSFHSAYAARIFLDTIISGVPLKWTAEDRVLLENGMSIRSERPNQLADALEHTMSPTECQWRAPEPYPRTWLQFIGQRPTEREDLTVTVAQHPAGAPSTPKSRKSKSPQERKARAVAKVRAGDHVTIAQIAADLKSEPRILRALLRKLAIEKPAHGWAWPPSEAARIQSKLRGMLRGPAGA